MGVFGLGQPPLRPLDSLPRFVEGTGSVGLKEGATMLALLHRLGVAPSLSRPAASDDNPYSEALFKTLKYSPDFPEAPFETVAAARRWTARFVADYNGAHRHSAIKFVTPEQRHRGEDADLLARRHALYEAARAAHPERWSGPTRNWEPIAAVVLNPGKPLRKTEPPDALAACAMRQLR